MLSVLDIKKNKPFLVWLGITVFCIVFAFVYELFSFGVYSNHMIFLFVYPLVFGMIPCYIMHASMNRIWNDGVLLLTGSSLLAGVFEIYGTSSIYTSYLWYLGIFCLIVSCVYQLWKGGKDV